MTKPAANSMVPVLIAALLVLASCGKSDLSRSGAEAILKQKKFGSISRGINLQNADFTGVEPGAAEKHVDAQLIPLRNAGWIAYEKTLSTHRFWGAKFHYKIVVADKLKPFVENSGPYIVRVTIANLELGEVTGIAKSGESTREVVYTLKAVPNALAAAFPSEPLNSKELQSVKETAHFQLFDDGWRSD